MALELRGDFHARMLRLAAKGSKNGPQARRLLALAAIYEGATRTRAAEIGGVIPNPIDQYPCAHSRRPMDMMRQG